ncbi:MAG: ABC transporter ATP-binding protein [Chloroflexota bacterium]
MKLVVHHVSKQYTNQLALNAVSFACAPGICAILGPNGSGKSTLLRILATLLPADSGNLAYNGLPYASHLRAIRHSLGYVPQQLDLPGHMTPRSLLRYVARLKGGHAERHVAEMLDTLGLRKLARQRIDRLSGGQVRRLGIAQALLGYPQLLLLDEPFAGLGIDERRHVMQVLHRRKHQTITLLSTHLPDEIAALAEQVVVLQQGRVIADDTPDALCAWALGRVHELRVPAHDVERYTNHYSVSRVSYDDRGALLRVVGDLPPDHTGVSVNATLEDAYLLLQQRAEVAQGKQ